MLEMNKANVPPNKEAIVLFQTISIHGGLPSTPVARSSDETVLHAGCNVIVSIWKISGYVTPLIIPE